MARSSLMARSSGVNSRGRNCSLSACAVSPSACAASPPARSASPARPLRSPARPLRSPGGLRRLCARPGRRPRQRQTLASAQPEPHRPAAGLVGKHDKDVPDRHVPVQRGFQPRLYVSDANCGHGCPPCSYRDEVGTVGADVLAEPAARLVQAGPGRPHRLVGVVALLDGAPLPVRQRRDRGPQRLGAVQVLGRRQPLRRRRMQPLGPVPEQQHRSPPPRRALHVPHDPGQPGTEPVRLAQPLQRHERLQERLLHDVVHVISRRAQPHRPGPHLPPVPLDQQPERRRVPLPRQPHQIPVANLHTDKCRPAPLRLPPRARILPSQAPPVRSSHKPHIPLQPQTRARPNQRGSLLPS